MARIQIDLSEDTQAKVLAMATAHGHKLKPFIEYLLQLQVGELPPATAKPVRIQPDAAPIERIPDRIPEQGQHIPDTIQRDPIPEQPAKVDALKAARPVEAIPEAGTVSRNASEYTKRTDYPNISTNGTHFLMSLLGVRSFHATIEEAKAARVAIREFPE